MAASEFKRIEALAELTVTDDPAAFRLPANIVASMVTAGVKPDEISRIVGLSVSGLGQDDDGRLSPEQSDRAVRLARIVALAERVFANREKAFLWLRLPSEQLDGRTPFAYLTTETGARFVEEMLMRIDHGIAA
ncbi:type II RES/Xre toxin-antitoxin system antitoxin [Chthonobacter albigriseus]|uniref:type II RES/Xre toxin-antitoxin system antitoxin n=1 Tax=Chthonobacter albigriseus TaxID=1683161 RepID=UPI0015EEEFA1|nr:antitoxin Xre/MbcA/ParS toxin-binding domain-containing protein [Chthonobacter albigriseus]